MTINAILSPEIFKGIFDYNLITSLLQPIKATFLEQNKPKYSNKKIEPLQTKTIKAYIQ